MLLKPPQFVEEYSDMPNMISLLMYVRIRITQGRKNFTFRNVKLFIVHCYPIIVVLFKQLDVWPTFDASAF